MRTVFAPPPNKGLVQLNRALFNATQRMLALRIPASASGAAMETLRDQQVPAILSAPRLRTIVEDPSESSTPRRFRLLLLDPSLSASKLEDLPGELQRFASTHNADLVEHTISLGYDYWSTDQILRSILPDDFEVPSAFETIGHIAHLNLRDQYQPFKQIIGQVILDKSKHIKTVVNKTDNIDHTFRFFQMELLAGEDNMMAELKEGGCQFRFDFSKVYWNSRLQGEHDRIVKLFSKGDLVCDVFAGVGPFALPAAKTAGCIVFANDLNPQSYKFLVENIKLNKLEGRIRPFNMDGRQFIRQSHHDLNDPAIWETITEIKPAVASRKKSRDAGADAGKDSDKDAGRARPETPKPAAPLQTVIGGVRYFRHYVMNLPATAIEFLDAFHGLYSGKRELIKDDQLPLIHCHCFSRGEDLEADVVQRVERVIGMSLGDNLVAVHNVRTVAPNKTMMCISFRLPPALAFAEPGVLGKRKSVDDDEAAKRDRRDDGPSDDNHGQGDGISTQ
ncbi:tRNA(m(1)G37)methyltransferase [Polyrhizophydium stewartii]|uniref:tRNA (guanine(37)-N1)-methyltransferase n=1 Tax=Polyrhizophydium stewartii TaxID=2732419 RepID=A0ABR4MW87_9FUNG|nr:tRNA (guanine(37)-N1)-methyltransferase [Polyrhizophydium stewartii]